MNYEEKVLNILNEKKIITTNELTKLNIPNVVLTILIEKKKIERAKRGNMFYQIHLGMNIILYCME